jgi:hypothetical protein
VFGETVRSGPWIVAEVFGAALVAASTLLLVRSPLLQGSGGETEQDRRNSDRSAARS